MTIQDKIAALPEMLKQEAETDNPGFDFIARCAVDKHNCDALAARLDLALEVLRLALEDYQHNSILMDDYQEWSDIWQDIPAVLAACGGESRE
jgi:hypothetical protein